MRKGSSYLDVNVIICLHPLVYYDSLYSCIRHKLVLKKHRKQIKPQRFHFDQMQVRVSRAKQTKEKDGEICKVVLVRNNLCTSLLDIISQAIANDYGTF